MRGFFDTDGSIYCGKDYNYPNKRHIKLRANFTSGYPQIINEVYFLLRSLGVHSLLIKPQKQANSNWGDINRVQIDGPNVLDFMRIVGSKNEKHLSKLKIWKKFGFCPPYTSLKQRQKILNNQLNPEDFYARVGERSNPQA